MAAEVAPGIFTVDTSTVQGNIGFIVGRRVALAVDAGIDDVEGRRIADAVRAIGFAADHLVYTHPHLDHVLGGRAFQGGTIFAHQACATSMLAQVPEWAHRYQKSEDQVRDNLGFPNVRFPTGLEIDLGNREVQILPTPGHAPGVVCVLVPDQKLLFAGDTIVSCIPPSFKDGDSGVMEATLREMAALDLDVVIPGHGPILRGRSQIEDTILWLADYLGSTRAHVADRYGHETPEEIVASAPYDAFVGDRFDPTRHQMAWRHDQTILSLIAEHGRARS